MGSCSGSCAKPLPSPPPHYFTLVKGWSEGEGRVAGLEAAHAAELKEEYRITTLPPLPDRHPIHSLGGIFLLCSAPQIRLRCRSPRLDSGLPTNDFAARACCHEPDDDTERNSYRVFGAFPLPSVSVRVRAPPAAANSSNGRRRQTTCGKSFSNRRERKRGRSGAFENEPPPRSVNRKGGRVSLVSCRCVDADFADSPTQPQRFSFEAH